MRSYEVIHMPYYRENPYQDLLLDNLKIFGLDVKYGKMVQYFSVVNISLLFNVIRNFGVDIIHLHWQHPFLLANSRCKTIVKSLLFVSQLVILKIVGKKVVWTVHNVKHHENKHKELEVFFSSILAWFADAIIAHCKAAKREIQTVLNVKKDKIVVIPHGTWHNAYENAVSREEARNRLNLLPRDFTFLHLGRIRPYKGLQELIEDFQKLEANDTKLIIAGKPENKQLVEFVTKKVGGDSNIRLILRFVPDSEIQMYMNAADIMILPYRDILTSGAAILGMSFGKPIIAPRLGCIPDVLDDSGGFLYDPAEEDGLLNAMRNALASRAKLREMGNYNLRLAKKLDWRDIAESTYRVYKRCLGR